MKRRKRRGRGSVHIFLIFMIFLLSLLPLSLKADKKLMEIVLLSGEMQIHSSVNRILDETIKEYTMQNQMQARQFFVQSERSISANTMLINDFCANIASCISSNLSALQNEKIKVPIGALSGYAAFANLGPSMVFSLMPVGSAIVDHETVFEAAGINQIHFQVYLTVESMIRIVNPLQKKDLLISRKIALIDTVIHGNIPENFFGNMQR